MAKLTTRQKIILAAAVGHGGNGAPGSEPDPELTPEFRYRVTTAGQIRQTTAGGDRVTADTII